MAENLDERYKITIYDKHVVAGEKSEATTSLMGSLNISQNGYTISYREHAGDLAGTVTNIRVTEPNLICLHRDGAYETDLILELQKRHNCHYDTPYGGFMMGVYAHSMESSMDISGGMLNFSYSLDVGGGEVSTNELRIKVKEMPNV